jgi:hypothetical protein
VSLVAVEWTEDFPFPISQQWCRGTAASDLTNSAATIWEDLSAMGDVAPNGVFAVAFHFFHPITRDGIKSPFAT